MIFRVVAAAVSGGRTFQTVGGDTGSYHISGV